jgi:hypothetical protein
VNVRYILQLHIDVDRVSCLDFTPDGRRVTANGDGAVHEWDLPSISRRPETK